MSCRIAPGARPVSRRAMRGLLAATLLVLAAGWRPGQAASASEFGAAERAHYAALCHARRDLDSCSDAVRWSPGDPVLLVALADALVRAQRLEEAIRDYQHAASLDPGMRGLEAKIKAAQAKLNERRAHKRLDEERAAAERRAAKRYSNLDPEAQSH